MEGGRKRGTAGGGKKNWKEREMKGRIYRWSEEVGKEGGREGGMQREGGR